MSNLISAAHLAAALNGATPVRVLDVRWRLGSDSGREDYRGGHLPGAIFVDLERELSAHGAPATEGRHPLPPIDELRAAVRRWGLHPGDLVVAYDDFSGLPAARLWWLLAHAGYPGVRVLDGGLTGWVAAGGRLEEGENEAEPGSLALSGYGHRPVLDIDGAARVARLGVLVDSRAPERFRGESEPLDPRAGHIPGAVNIPASAYQRDGRFLPPAELAAVFAAQGIFPAGEGVDSVPEIGASCGSGITAAHTALALGEIGIEAAVYPGSWSQWSRTEGRPVATGPA